VGNGHHKDTIMSYVNMETSRKYRLRFHISHPELSSEYLTEMIGLTTAIERSVGMPRTTKSGKYLGGLYGRTDVSFNISDGVVNHDEKALPIFINDALKNLPLTKIKEITNSSGLCFFSVGVYSNGNMLCDFEASLLSELAKFGIGLKLDFYGGSD